ncbi:MAG: NrfD/PsrC family molybdoenzyme membrane anchor subunit [Actinomycetota bacterium]
MVKRPVWKPEVPWYFFTGGLAGASSVLALAARVSGDRALAASARRAAAAGALVSPVLLVADLGVPSRFLNMLRVFRPTSPLNLGSWLLCAYVPSAVGAAALGERAGWPVLGTLADLAAAAGGLGIATYPAVLVADTATPVWHEARRELPFVFASAAAATAGAAALATAPAPSRPTARRMVVAATVVELAAVSVMDRHLGPLAHPYHEGRSGRFHKAARVSAVSGAVLAAAAGHRRAPAVAAAALVMAGALCERWAVFTAGWQSAARPEDTIGPQRSRAGAGHGA